MVWQMNAEVFFCLIIPALCCFPVDWESWFHKKCASATLNVAT